MTYKESLTKLYTQFITEYQKADALSKTGKRKQVRDYNFDIKGIWMAAASAVYKEIEKNEKHAKGGKNDLQ
ncbi:MAG: hypothetical protein KBS54_04440 [Synergistaceae bacterium]|nr:hypothetical protein [Candidatus Equadaptatus faecalis]MDO5829398.1 hypothetical protein [Methanocorpusculum sp.]